MLTVSKNAKDAYTAFYKSTWNDACQHKAYFQLARIAVQQNNYKEAPELINKSLGRNYSNPRAHHLKVITLRKLNNVEKAFAAIEKAFQMDPFNYGCYFEKYLLLQSTSCEDDAEQTIQQMRKLMKSAFNNYMEYAIDYIHAGLYSEASQLLSEYLNGNATIDPNPMAYYYLAWLCRQMGEEIKAGDHYLRQYVLESVNYT